MKLGTADITAVKLGAVDVTRVMLGAEQVWPSEGGPAVYDQNGITTLGALTTPANGAQQVGWEFTVGAADIEVGKLRLYLASTFDTETMRIWRVSDTSLVASASVLPVLNAWAESDLASPVTLSSGANYVVTTRRNGGVTRQYNYSTGTSGFVFAPEITFVRSRFINGDGYPSSTLSGVFGITDIVFAAP